MTAETSAGDGGYAFFENPRFPKLDILVSLNDLTCAKWLNGLDV